MKLTFLVCKGFLCFYSRHRVDYAGAYVPPPPPQGETEASASLHKPDTYRVPRRHSN